MRFRASAGVRSALGHAVKAFRGMPKVLPASLGLVAAATVLLVLVAGAAVAQVVVTQMSKLPEDAVFRVGDTTITEKDLQQRVHVLEVVYGVQRPTDPKQLDEFNRATAKALAVSEVLKNIAMSRHIVISEKKANDQITKIIEQQYGNDREAYRGFLADNKVSESEVVEEFSRQIATAELFADVTKDVKPATDKDAQDYYEKNKSQMVSPEQRNIRNVVTADRQQADLVVKEANSGRDFASLVSQYSIDESTKQTAGDLGLVSARQLDPSYAEMAFGVPNNAVFGPVQTAQGWNVGQITKIQPVVPLSFDQLQDDIKAKLDNDAKFGVWGRWLRDQLEAADVEYTPQYLPADPTAPPQSLNGG